MTVTLCIEDVSMAEEFRITHGRHRPIEVRKA
jgi:hypothetical protein